MVCVDVIGNGVDGNKSLVDVNIRQMTRVRRPPKTAWRRKHFLYQLNGSLRDWTFKYPVCDTVEHVRATIICYSLGILGWYVADVHIMIQHVRNFGLRG